MKKDQYNLDFAIFNELKKDNEYISGERLAQRLKISRQALWKHISKLIHKGYEIIAVPHLGYKLISSPDKLYPWEIQYNLNTKILGREIYYTEVADSTQDIAWELGTKSAKEGMIVFAEIQKKGKGRIGRKWISPAGGVYFSLLLKPDFLSIQDMPKITLLVVLGCLYGIKKATGIECAVKWPNDIYLQGKKIGGILCETNAEVDKIHFVVVGIGINVNSKDLPSEATSLFLHLKKKLSRVEITKSILREIEICYLRAKQEGFRNLLKEWESFCFLWGKRAKVKVFNQEIEGEACGIDEKGYLLLRRDNGFVERISTGDVARLNVN